MKILFQTLSCALLILTTFFGYSQSTFCLENGNLNDSLKLYYPFSGNAGDSSGNGINGTTSGSPTLTSDRYGNANNAYDFDGVNDYIQTFTSFDYQERTVSVWVEPDVFTSTGKFFLCQDASSTLVYGQLQGRFNNGVLRVRAGGESNLYSTSATVNQWLHVVLVRTSTSCLYYLNGSLVGTQSSGTNASTTLENEDLVIGSGRAVGTNLFDGKIDDIRLYNRALSVEEIEALYCPAQVSIQQNDTTIALGTTLNLTNFCNNFPHTWTVNGAQVSTSDTLTQTFSALGTYEIVLSSTDGFCVDYDTVVVRILPEPTCLGVDTIHKISDTSGGVNLGLDNFDSFGVAVCDIGDINNDGVADIAVGATKDDDGGTDRGAVYILKLNANGTVQEKVKISSDSGGFGTGLVNVNSFGSALANMGDINGDGINDLAVGARQSGEGAVWILFLDSNGSVDSKQKIANNQGGLGAVLSSGDAFGGAVKSVGDLDGNGVNDLFVGAPATSVSAASDGKCWLLFLNASGNVINSTSYDRSNALLSNMLGSGDQFGRAVATLGDLRGTGNVELVVGAYQADVPNVNSGAIYLLSIDSMGVLNAVDRIASNENGLSTLAGQQRFGVSLDSPGDIDGDGYKELLVGHFPTTGSTQGTARILSLDSLGYVFNDVVLDNNVSGLNLGSGDYLGVGASFIGDFNNDGFNDIAVGAFADDDGGTDRGSVYLFSLRDTCCPLLASFTGDNNVCEGNALTFSNTSQFGSSTTSYAWYINDSLVASSSNLTYTFNQAGNVLVKLVANDSCERSFTMQITVHLPAVADAGSSSFVCLGDSVQLNASGGISYQWSNPTLLSNDTVANPFAFPTATSIFNVTVTDTNGCVDSDNLAIIVNPIPVFDVSGDSLICLGDSTTLVADNAALTYNWSPTSSLSSSTGFNVFAFPSQSTTYIIEGTDANTCSNTVHYMVLIDTSLVASVLSVSDALCFGSAEGTAVGSAIGGTTPYNFAWPNGTMNDSVSSLTAGSYTFTVTDIEGCADSAVAVIGEPDSISVAFSETPVVCFSESNGGLNTSPSGGTGLYTYAWSTGATTQNISGLTQGAYGLTITDANNCVNTFSTQVTEPGILQANFTAITNVSCLNGNDGSASIQGVGGTAGYSYAWSNGSAIATASSLAAGQYFVTTTDANNCTRLDSITITEPATAVSSTISVIENVSCFGFADGIAQVSGVGGTPGYSFQWSNGSDSAVAVGLSFGTTYSVTTTDTLGCAFTNTISVTQPTQLALTLSSVSNITCNSFDDGVYQVQASQATAPYSYSWSTGATNDTIFGVSPGYKTVTVTDANACVLIDSILVTEPSPRNDSLAVTQNIDCFGNATGAVTSFAQGGYGQYTYSWNNGTSGSNSISGLTTGWYIVTIADSGSCVDIDSIFVDQPTLLISSTQLVQDVSCFGGSDGSASVQGIDGTPPYSYAWSNGDADSLAENLSLGQYLVTITDGNNCSTIDSITIAEPATAVTSATSVIENVSCFGFSDGSAQVNGIGGTPGYSFQWSNGSDSTVAVGLIANTSYSVTTTDTLGCTFVNTINVTEPTPLQVDLYSVTNITCNGFDDGVYRAEASQATAPYAYSWSTSATNDTIFGVSPGYKSVTVSDANACVLIDSILVTEPSPRADSVAVTQAIDCFGNATGTVQYFAQGGYGQYTYDWSNSATGSNNNISSLISGWYSATVTDSGSCAVIDSIFVDQPTLLISTTQLVQDVSCFGGSDASASAQGINGTPPYSYAWSNGDVDSLAENLSIGQYFVTITDVNNCSTLDSITISEPTLLVASTVLDSNVTCFGYANGISTADAAGGTAPYSFLWDSGESTPQADSLLAGNRIVTVTDALGCTDTASILISQPTAVVAILDSTKDVLCNGFYDGLAFTSANGGTGSHTFSWNTGDTIDDIDSLTSGTYILTVYDSIGCFDTAAVTIIELTPVVPNINWTNVTCFAGNDGAATTAATGGGTTYSYSWNTGDTTTFLNTLIADTFIVHVVDEFTCNTFDTAFVTQPDSIEFSFEVTDISCTSFQDGALKVDATGGTSTLSFAWSISSSDSVISTLDSGYYSVTATDINGCFNSDSAYIFEPSPLLVSTQLLDSVDCFGLETGDALATASGGVGIYQFAWSNGDTIDSLIDVFSGTYTVTLTDSNNCTISENVFVNEPAVLALSLDSLKNARCKDELNGYLSVTSAGGNLGYQYVWNSGLNDPFIDSLSDGTYSVTVTDARGCLDSLSLNITEPDSLHSSIAYTDTLVCKYDGNGLLTSSAIGGTLPYAFTWENGPNTNTYSALSDGTYRVTITDVQGCQDSSEFVIDALSHLTSQVDSVYDILCFQDMSGFIQASADSGTAPFVWNWSSGNTTDSAFALSGGNYYYTVTDSFACVDSGNAFVFEPTQLTLSIDSVFEVLCFGDDDGQIFTTAQGGIAPYGYLWSNADQTDDINTLDSGMYVLTVTDTNGCQITDSALIMEPAAPLSTSFAVTDANCLGGATGSIVTTPAGGSAPYEINWSTGDTTALTDTLVAGMYYVTIIDDHGCVYIDSAEVFEPLSPDTAVIAKTNVSCFGFANGMLTSSFINGISPFNYLWNNSETTATISSLDTGDFDVLIIDSIGCTQVAFDTITQPDSLISNITQIDTIQCFGDSSASLIVSTIGGTQPYNWTWNTGDTSTLIDQLPVGNYSLTLTDALGCVDSSFATILEPSKLVIDSLFFDVPSCFGFNDGLGFVSAMGGIPEYEFAWSTNENSDSAFTLNAGAHTVTVTDQNGCFVDSSFVVGQPDSLIVNIVISENANCDNSADGVMQLDISGGRLFFQSFWSNGSSNTALEDSLSFGDYSVTVNDAYGCIDSAKIFLPFDHLNPNLDLGEDQIFCDGFNVPIAVPDTLETINWSTGETSPEITIDETDEYVVNVVDSFGCIDADTIFIEKKYETLFDLGNDTVLCSDLNVTQWPLSVPGFANYNWSNNSTESSISVSVNSSYWLQATNEFGCVSSDTIALSFEECYAPLVYPIPTKNELFIEWPKVLDEELTFSLIGMNGQVVYSSEEAGAIQHILELGNLASGVYYLTIEGEDFMQEFRIVKI